MSHHGNLLFASRSYESNLVNHIISVENFDKEYQILQEKSAENEHNQIKTELSLNRRGLLLHKNRMHIPNTTEIKLIVMCELHKQQYSGHPGY